MAKETTIRNAETIISETETPAKPAAPQGFNATAVEADLVRARNQVAQLHNREAELSKELTQIRADIEIANKIKTALEAAKAQAMEIDRLKEKQDGNGK